MTRDQHWLDDILSAVDLVFFSDRLRDEGVTVRWRRFRPAKHIALYGTCRVSDNETLIEIHQAFRNEWVPVHVVVSLVFHECLHHIHGAEHSPAFRRDEQRDPHALMSDAWCIDNFERLNAARPPAKEPAC